MYPRARGIFLVKLVIFTVHYVFSTLRNINEYTNFYIQSGVTCIFWQLVQFMSYQTKYKILYSVRHNNTEYVNVLCMSAYYRTANIIRNTWICFAWQPITELIIPSVQLMNAPLQNIYLRMSKVVGVGCCSILQHQALGPSSLPLS